MKGILFGGCSFTWGQGLYFYSDLVNLPYGTQNYGFDYKNINESMLRYKNAVRFPRVVAQHFKTFEVVREDIGKLYGNGGSEDETFSYFDYLFNVERKFKYVDFDYIVIQLSNVWRNDFIFELNGIEYRTKIMELFLYDHIEKDVILSKELDEYCKLHNYTFDDIKDFLINQQYKRLKEKVIFYQNRNIKVKIVCWLNDLLPSIKNDETLNHAYVPIKHNNLVFETIQDLFDYDKNYEIEYDLLHNKGIVCQDKHPNVACHEVIANSIIENIKKDL
jgi:hypothetical protein